MKLTSRTYGVKYKRVVDGGYLSYVLGIRDDMRFWDEQRFLFRDALICMDSGSSYRREIYPEYKSRRAVQRWEDERKAVNYEKVQKFRARIIADLALEICQLPGVEGDDLVALTFLLDPTLDVVAVDKDLHPIPGMYQAMLRGAAKEIKNLSEKVPQYIGRSLRKTPASLLILQALRGDKSDSIPRLLPSPVTEAKAMWNELYLSSDRETLEACHTTLGPSFIRNLKLVLIPGPFLLDKEVSTSDLFDMVSDASYWNPDHFQKVVGKLLESREPEWRVRDLWGELGNNEKDELLEELEREETMPVKLAVNDVDAYWTE